MVFYVRNIAYATQQYECGMYTCKQQSKHVFTYVTYVCAHVYTCASMLFFTCAG